MINISNIEFVQDRLTEVLTFGFLAFLIAIALTPIYTHYAYKHKWWKVLRSTSTTGEKAKLFTKLHKEKHARNIPTMAGIIIIASVTIITLLFNLDREQTWLPLAAFVGAGLVGLADDIINIKGLKQGVAGLSSSVKFMAITAVAAIGGFYFVTKLGYDSFQLTFIGDVKIGYFMIPLFILVVVSTANAVNISDGLDGLAGGLLTSSYLAFGIIAILQQSYGIAAFCVTIVGALLAYLWFNIFPARFMMGDSGSFALGTSLGVIAMLTNSLILLPIIGFIFVVEAGSSALQIASKKIRGKKLFNVAPIHHNLEFLGWPEVKVTMRFWIIGQVCSVIGIILAIIGGHI